ncbi:MAG: hypothetical protein WC721_14750 [Victivallaceae bacterium]
MLFENLKSIVFNESPKYRSAPVASGFCSAGAGEKQWGLWGLLVSWGLWEEAVQNEGVGCPKWGIGAAPSVPDGIPRLPRLSRTLRTPGLRNALCGMVVQSVGVWCPICPAAGFPENLV